MVDVLLARGRSLDVAKEARFVAPNAAVRADFDVSAAALPLVELAGKVAEVGLENPRLFQCAVAALALMDKAAAGTIGAENAVVVGCADRARILCAACLLKELAFAGFRPSLAHCAVCGEPLSFAAPSSAFSPHEGGCYAMPARRQESVLVASMLPSACSREICCTGRSRTWLP